MTDKTIEGRVTAFCDGGSRGNPGPAGYGVFIQAENGAPLAELSEFIGTKTNNVAEYSGLLAALDWAVTNSARELRVVSDSELMVKQIKGQYSVKSPDLKPLYEEAKRRVAKLGKFEMQHVLRGKNKEADRLANEAMDRGTGKGPAGRPGASRLDLSHSGALRPGTSTGASVADTPRKLAAPNPIQLPTPAATPPRKTTPASHAQGTLPLPEPALKEVTGFVKNGVVHLVEGTLPEGTFVRILPAKR